MFIAGTEWGYANVFPVSPDEYEYLTAVALENPRKVLERLQVLRARDRRDVPERPCVTCHRTRPLYDLYNGECRDCHDEPPRSPSAVLVA